MKVISKDYYIHEITCHNFIGASLNEPHINGTAMREFYIIYYQEHMSRPKGGKGASDCVSDVLGEVH